MSRLDRVFAAESPEPLHRRTVASRYNGTEKSTASFRYSERALRNAKPNTYKAKAQKNISASQNCLCTLYYALISLCAYPIRMLCKVYARFSDRSRNLFRYTL